MKRILAATARSAGASFASVGIAVDWVTRDGWEFLQRFGPFDEIIVGRNWLNSASLHYMWRELPGEPVVPQVVVVERSILLDGAKLEVSPDRALLRKVGADEVIAWAVRGGGLPLGAAVPRPGIGHANVSP